MTLLLDDLIGRLNALPVEERKEIERLAEEATRGLKWIPNPGPQSDAFYCPADVLLYGGQGGGGKSDLGLGLAFTEHKRSLVLRRQYSNLSALTERAIEINGSRTGYNGSPPPLLRTDDGRYIQFGANQHLGDEQAWQGHAFDYKYFDEAVQFLEQQVRFHLGWLRSVDPKQRCRAVLGSNPPIDASGDWIIKMFRPWLDITHHKPAKHGELRWFVTAPDGEDVEVDGPEPIQLPGAKDPAIPTSRTFIAAALKDNPFLVRTNYQSKLDALPEPLRSAVRDGNFMAARQDAAFQVIPTQWVIEAQARWKPDGGTAFQMTAMSLDPAGGGKDAEELCWRNGNWYSEIITAKGEKTAGAQSAATAIFINRRDGAPVVIDAGGGYAGAVIERLNDNKVPYIKFNGAEAGLGKTRDSGLPFANKRSEAFWRFREALDPTKPGGSDIALPPDPELTADLTAPCLDPKSLEQRGVIQVEPKDNLRKRLGRSPGKGDVVVMCWSGGNLAVRRALKMFANEDRPTSVPGGLTSRRQRRK